MNNNNSNKNAQHSQYGSEFSLFVGDLPYDCSDDKLQRLFQSKFKSVKRVQIIRNEDGSSRGFGFIRFEERADFQAALAEGMKIDNTTLRLDTAHRNFKNRSRFNSFNSTGSNNSNQHNHHQFNNSNSNLHHQHHHHHHHNLGHHHHHNQAHQQHGSQQHHPPTQQGQNNKIILPDQTIGGQKHQQTPNHQGSHVGAGGNTSSNVSASGSGGASGNSRVNNDPLHHAGISSGVPVAPSVAAVHHHTHAHPQQTPHTHTQHNAHPNHNLYNTPQQKNNQHHTVSENRGPKPSHGQGGDDTVSVSQTQNKQQQPPRPTLHQPTQQQTQSTPLSQPQTQQNLSQMNNSTIGVSITSATANITATTTATTSLSSSDVSLSSSTLPNTQHNINTGQPSLVPDLRGYGHAAMMDNPHMMSATDQQSVMPPSSMYGHIYPYGPPPPFGYMPPPPQPNPVIPISAVPPAPPNQASSSGVGQQHSLTVASGNRYNNTHHQHHPHQTQQAHATAQDANAMNTMTAGVQAPPPHQAPFYYYYPNPLYFDQTGAGAPPNLYHPQSFHPQFFALPNPAYHLPNAHSYTNQHQTQPPLASQSDASATLVNQQQPQPQSHQQQVNLRTRDIDAPIE